MEGVIGALLHILLTVKMISGETKDIDTKRVIIGNHSSLETSFGNGANSFKVEFEKFQYCDSDELLEQSGCLNHAICLFMSAEVVDFKCICTVPFTGEKCEMPISPKVTYKLCSHSEEQIFKCENGGTCQVRTWTKSGLPVPDFRCSCHAAYTGKKCDVRAGLAGFQDCDDYQEMEAGCKNGATCLSKAKEPRGLVIDFDLQPDYWCVCQMSYTGKKCEIEVDHEFNSHKDRAIIRGEMRIRAKTKKIALKSLMIYKTNSKDQGQIFDEHSGEDVMDDEDSVTKFREEIVRQFKALLRNSARSVHKKAENVVLEKLTIIGATRTRNTFRKRGLIAGVPLDADFQASFPAKVVEEVDLQSLLQASLKVNSRLFKVKGLTIRKSSISLQKVRMRAASEQKEEHNDDLDDDSHSPNEPLPVIGGLLIVGIFVALVSIGIIVLIQMAEAKKKKARKHHHGYRNPRQPYQSNESFGSGSASSSSYSSSKTSVLNGSVNTIYQDLVRQGGKPFERVEARAGDTDVFNVENDKVSHL